MSSRVAILFVFLIGVTLLTSSFILFPHSGQESCGIYIEQIEQEDALDGYLSRIQYPQLSEDGKAVFNMALDDEDNFVTLHGGDCPDEFSYSDSTSYYLIINNSTYYQAETGGNDGGLYRTEDLLNALLLIGGLCLILLSIGSALKNKNIKSSELLRP